MAHTEGRVRAGDEVLESHPGGRSGLRIVSAAVVLTVLAVVLGLGIGAAIPLAGPPVAAPTSAPPAPPLLPGPVFHGDLRSLLLAPPAGTTATKGLGGDDFTVTLNQAAAFYAVNGQIYLFNLGFQRGASWKWTNGGVTVLIVLLQFDNEVDAFRWKAGDVGQQAEDPRVGAQADLPTIAGARYAVQAKPNDLFTVRVYVSRNDIGVILRVDTSGAADVPAAEALAEHQYGQLP
jgi:hypothetical protein